MKTDTVIIGAGVVGLAIAREIARKGHEVIILEAHPRAGEETSSRNSGVIHSGIYYPTGSNKAIWCVEGNRLLYEYAKKRNVAHKNTGKIVLATSLDEVDRLELLLQRGIDNEIKGLKLLSKKEVMNLQKEIKAERALYCPSSGIIDPAELVQSLEAELQEQGTISAFNSTVQDIEVMGDSGFTVNIKTEESFSIEAKNVVNSAGLNAVHLAKQIKEIPEGVVPKAYFAKGHYFQLSGKHPFHECLVYPINNKDSLGVHVSVDISGKARFGPDVTWIEKLDYTFDETLKDSFVEAIQSYWPGLNPDKLLPDYTGIRPKIYGPDENPADFLIQTSAEHGIKGLVNLLGIESPGLTCAFAIARRVAKTLF